MTTLEKIKAEIQERIDIIGNDDYANGLAEAIIIHDKYAEQEPKILDDIDFAIDASNGDTNYFVGLRNGLRCAKSLVDGEKPQYESCAEQEPCDDAVSRQSAIFLASDLKHDLPDDKSIADIVMAHNEGILEYQTQLSLLPPVRPQEPKWIPVSEKLPDGQTEVIVSILDNSGDTAFDYTSSGWVTTDGEYWIVDNEICNYVIAWMPLPKPYEPQESEEI